MSMAGKMGTECLSQFISFWLFNWAVVLWSLDDCLTFVIVRHIPRCIVHYKKLNSYKQVKGTDSALL